MKAVATLTIYRPDGSIFSHSSQESHGLDRQGVHAIQRNGLDSASRLLDVAQSVLDEKTAVKAS